MSTLNTVISANITTTLADDAPTSDLGASSGGTAKAAIAASARLSDGTGAGAADLTFGDRRTVTDGATEDLDLAGVLTDAFGDTITAVRVKAIMIKASAANTTNLTVGADATAPWIGLLNAAGTITLRPGASFLASAGEDDATGMAVTATTADIIQVVNGAGADATYDIVIVGASA